MTRENQISPKQLANAALESRSFDETVRIVRQLAELGAEAKPAVPELLELLKENCSICHDGHMLSYTEYCYEYLRPEVIIALSLIAPEETREAVLGPASAMLKMPRRVQVEIDCKDQVELYTFPSGILERFGADMPSLVRKTGSGF